jgi:hypothetical protein
MDRGVPNHQVEASKNLGDTLRPLDEAEIARSVFHEDNSNV